MSEVKTSHSLDKVKIEFDDLLKNLAKILKEVRPRTNILNTKLGTIKDDLSKIEQLDSDSLARILEIVIKYNSINKIFLEEFDYNKKDLAKIIEGKTNYDQDSNEGYNDYFFELSMGVRLLQALKHSNTKINLDGVCDVIIDDSIAIECKYIHSPSNLVKNIKKANKQIEKRVRDNQAKHGFIALDLSHICPREKVNDFASYTFKRFVNNYEVLKSKGHIEGNILEQILCDNNFYKIISSYIMSEVETALYGELGFSYDMGTSALAIIFQSMNSFSFEYGGQILPLTTRGMTYFLNSNLDRDQAIKIQKYIHGLAVGI